MAGIYFEGAEYTSPRPLNQVDALIRGAAAVECQFGRVVRWGEGGFELADPVDGRASGLCVSILGPAGKRIEVLTAGAAEAKDWTDATGELRLEPGAAYFLQPEGRLGRIPPSAGFIVRVGRAASPTVLAVTFDLKVA